MNIIVERPGSTVEVAIMLDKSTGKYAFVNLTKRHVCRCRFNSILEAVADLERERQRGHVISWKLKEESFPEEEGEEFEVILKVDENLRTLVGEEAGQEVYKRDVEPILSSTEIRPITVIFPSHIEDVSISFIKGFKRYLTAHDFRKNIKIKGDEYVVNKFREIDIL